MTKVPTFIPRTPRIDARHPAVLIDSDGNEMPVTVTDLSNRGFRIEAEETLFIGENIKIGEHVRLRVARYGDFPAQIRWALGREAGGLFLDPVQDLDA
jgi:PilZ domain